MLDSIFGLMREHEFTYQDVANAEVVQSFASTVMLYEEPESDLKGKSARSTTWPRRWWTVWSISTPLPTTKSPSRICRT